MLTLISFLLMLISILTVVLAANTADYQMKRDCKKKELSTSAPFFGIKTVHPHLLEWLETVEPVVAQVAQRYFVDFGDVWQLPFCFLRR